MNEFDGLNCHLGNIHRLSPARSRSISPENFSGAKGEGGKAKEGTGSKAARELGPPWKIFPFVKVPAKSTFTLADIKGPGAIQQIWMTSTGNWRWSILRFYWDDQEQPSVECPVGDFFACGWGQFAPVTSLAVGVHPGSAFNCYWPMPFRRRCRITIENLDDKEFDLYFQVNYALNELAADVAYFHAQFRRVNPLPYKEVCTIIDGVQGRGHYAGTYLAWGVNNTGWWGEGEIKFYLDGDRDYPTICGTGTEDYFGGSYNFESKSTKQYQEYTGPYCGLPQVIRPDGVYRSQTRFGLYRWHLPDPVRFAQDLRVTIQALGWRSEGRYLPLQDDIASVAYWYQALPTAPFPDLPAKDFLEII